MLHLVGTYGHDLGFVQDDVRGLEHRIGKQAGVDRLVLLGLLLELGHPRELTHRRDGAEDPGELGVLGYGGLHEERGLCRIDAARQDADGHVEDPSLQLVGRVGLRDRVVVDDAEDAVVIGLKVDPVSQGPQIVT